MPPFRFGLLASTHSTADEWKRLARSAETLGYTSLYVTDHFDAQLAPLVAATLAADATERLHVGTLVLNNDLRNPVVLAKEFATLGLLAEGRIEIGLGAGWLQSDYEEVGIRFDGPGERIERLGEGLSIMKALWSDGEATFSGQHYSVVGARCTPRPAVAPRVIVGGGSRRVLALAGRQADIVNVNVSLASGHLEAASANALALDRCDSCIAWVRDSAGDRFGSLELQIYAFVCMVVGSSRAAVRSATLFGLEGEEALDRPNVLIGTVDDLCERLVARRERWGFSNIVVPSTSVESFAPVVDRLAGT